MKPIVYLVILLLIVPLQASLIAPLLPPAIRPDLGLAMLYAIALLTGPREGSLAGVALGLMQDVSSAGILGLSGLSRGLVGLLAGLLGRRVLDIASPSNIIFLAAFSLAEALLTALFLDIAYGSIPIGSLALRRMLPAAVATALAGYLLLRFVQRRDIVRLVLRRSMQKEL